MLHVFWWGDLRGYACRFPRRVRAFAHVCPCSAPPPRLPAPCSRERNRVHARKSRQRKKVSSSRVGTLQTLHSVPYCPSSPAPPAALTRHSPSLLQVFIEALRTELADVECDYDIIAKLYERTLGKAFVSKHPCAEVSPWRREEGVAPSFSDVSLLTCALQTPALTVSTTPISSYLSSLCRPRSWR